MSILIKGDNNGIAVDGDLTIEHLDFTFGKGVTGALGIKQTIKGEVVVDAEMVEESRTEEPQPFPQSLSRKDVMSFFEKLKKEGILDENLQPKVSNRNASILADYVGTKFNIRSKWKDIAELWGMDKEVLRSTFNNITNNEEDKAFYKRLAKL